MVARLRARLALNRGIVRLELTNPLMLRSMFRTQVFLGRTLVLLGLYMASPVPKPSLWLLEDWGGLSLSPYLWAAVFGLTGAVMMRSRRVAVTLAAYSLCFVEMVTIMTASYLALDLNGLTVFALCAAWQAAQDARELHCLLRDSWAQTLPGVEGCEA